MARREIKEVFYKTIGILYKYADEVTVIDYPPSPTRRSIDIIARIKGKPILVKVTDDIDKLPRSEVQELLGASVSLGTPPLIVSQYWGDEKLLDYVAYSLQEAYAVTPSTLEGILSGKGKVYVKTSRDGLHVSISGKKLREARVEAGMSLGRVAEIIGVSRKTVYEYERDSLEPSLERGRRLLEIFGNTILDPLNLFDTPSQIPRHPSDPHNATEESIIRRVKEHGGEAYHLKRSSMDITASIDERILFVVEHKKNKKDRVYAKLENTAKASRIVDGRAYYVYESSQISKSEIEDIGLEPLKLSELKELFRDKSEK